MKMTMKEKNVSDIEVIENKSKMWRGGRRAKKELLLP